MGKGRQMKKREILKRAGRQAAQPIGLGREKDQRLASCFALCS
ncbi:hypothetical protein STRDD11_00620 [Streptococcus sp. DD11]|nr:hypothetical protein STRDD11_00620 [Streptococcus sp. DD11]